MGTFAILAALLSLAGYAISAGTEAYNAKQANKQAEKLQEDAQEFNAGQQDKQNEFNKEFWAYQQSEQPLLQMQAYKNLGMSDAAAIQAIAGGSTQLGPTASNAASPLASPVKSNSGDILANLSSVFNDAFKNENLSADTSKKQNETVLTEKQCLKIDAEIDAIGKRLGMEQEQLDLAKALNASQIGLNDSQIEVNRSSIREISAKVGQLVAQTKNLNQDTLLKAVQESLITAQTELVSAQVENVQTDTTLKEAQVGYVQSQTIGQDIANDDNSLTLALRSARFEISKALGVDVDSDLVTQLLTAMVTGRYDTIDKLIRCVRVGSSGVAGGVERYAVNVANQYPLTKRFGFRDHISPSFQPTWNPSFSVKKINGRSFRW